ncbi:NAD(P)H-quinone oxidoreductase [Nesterenkonia sphaerica]|uniref:NAD(P)H-quinone oxidoreductase n=1 Tax=Nesterenkonia sphaerica TaxID=1804988 RepID=A0A5R9AL69_9MICC|nr:NAD(P)H-quinone oxidoreductase [Nesterenkonia sphaerica]TLP79552.1 NAD(P)H-quinone oxidoreductase [Nesterenkonia sphaerica]
MQAIMIDPARNGRAEALVPTQFARPTPQRGEVLIEVVSAGVNRADVMQRQGNYPPPRGASELPGLEVSGRIAALGPDSESSGFSIGEEVCALLSGGGYAEYVAVPACQVLPLPPNVPLKDAAALPEVACTVWSNLVMEAGLRSNESVLLHGGSSGIGTMAVQVAKYLGAHVFVTAGAAEKLEKCSSLGADVLVNYREEDFVERVNTTTKGRGVNVILDVVGGQYLERNVQALSPDGRLVVIGLIGGKEGKLDLGALLMKRGRVLATSLRSRSVEDKASIVREVRAHLWPLFAADRPLPIRTVIHSRHPLTEAAAAHREMEASQHIGKILLDVSN